MENDNNQQGFPEQNPEQIPNQGTGQPESENTYWEGGVNTQNSGATNEPQYQYQPEPPKKKSSAKLIAAVVIILLLLSAAATAFAFQAVLKNTIALMTKSPAEYYAYIEKNEINAATEKIKPLLKNTKLETAVKTSTNVTFDHDTIDALLKGASGMGLSDLESNLGITFKNLGLDGTVALKDKKIYGNLGLKLNDINIINAEIFMDTLKQEAMYRIPDLSPAFLKVSLTSAGIDTNDYMTLIELLSSERSADLLQRYSNIVVDQINNVTLDKNVPVSQGTLTVNCNKLTVTIDSKNAKQIITSVLTEAKQDEFIFELLPSLNITKDEYIKSIEDLEAKLADEMNSSVSDNSTIEMIVYVDSRGMILGRDFNMKENGRNIGSIGYTSLNKDNKDEFRIYLKDGQNNMNIQGYGSQTKENDAYNGKLTLELNNITGLPSNVKVDVDYKDVKMVMKDNHIYQYGTYTVSSLAFMGVDLVMENTVEKDIQHSKIIVQMGNEPLVTVDMTSEYLKDFTIPQPSSSDVVYDIADIGQYTSTIDSQKYIADLSNKLGINVQDVINNFMANLY